MLIIVDCEYFSGFCGLIAVANLSNVYVTVHQDALIAIYKKQQSEEVQSEEEANSS